MRKPIRALAILCLSALLLVAQLPNDESTHGQLNGRYWVGLEDSTAKGGNAEFALLIKAFFLQGLKEGIKEVGTPEQRAAYIAHSLSTQEITKALDEFYKIPENLPVPITWGLRVVALRAKGGDAVAVDKLVAGFRKASAAE
jgi:hypothetical protein